ncbi:hypothetical protein Ddye_028207 [Dipteronia dyeriana]|uniref:LRAT domain-containing protein n=1 Tax=Dipteronia dyeriana TaxID=168575 RepID=A0AAD9WS47_9ROSI|nr:hypothetical protein Ddye_028207 [Dipteronia dyeriana]
MGPAGHESNSFIIRSSLSDPQFSDVPCPQCGDHYSSLNNGVILSCIDCFLSGGELNLFEYRVSRVYFLAKVHGGTCTLAISDPPGDIFYHANILLQNGFGDYDVFKNNCEDFAIYCKTGMLVIIPNSTRSGQSGQAVSFEASSGRLNSDIGVRHDVAKVAVESLVPTPPTSAPVTYGSYIFLSFSIRKS